MNLFLHLQKLPKLSRRSKQKLQTIPPLEALPPAPNQLRRHMLRCQRLRATISERDSDDLDLELNPGSETGFKHVIKVKGKYQARIYDEKEKRQRSLPGTFETPKEAAKYRAIWKKNGFVLAAAKPRKCCT